MSEKKIVASNLQYFKPKLPNIFEVFPDNPNDPGSTGVKHLRASLEYVLKNRKPHTMAVQQYDIKNEEGRFEKKILEPLQCTHI